MAVALITVVLGWVQVAPAQAADQAETMEVHATLTAEGLIQVETELTFADAAPAFLTQQFALTQEQTDGRLLTYTVSQLTVRADGIPVTPQSRVKADVRTITIETGGARVIDINYVVSGATRANSDGTIRAAWPVLQGLSVGVDEVSGQFNPPQGVQSYFCEAGPVDAPRACDQYQGGMHGALSMSFSDGPRATHERVTVGALLDAGAVPVTGVYEQPWSFGRAFELSPGRVGLAAGVLVIGGLGLGLGVRRRRLALVTATPLPLVELTDAGAGQVQFTVHDRVRPGMAGTLIDQSVDPADVVASILDLAVRGHLLIVELPPARHSAAPDWQLIRQDCDEPLDDYERLLLDAVAPAGTMTRVSQLGGTVHQAIGDVQTALYRRIVREGWFSRYPTERHPWSRWAWVILALTIVIMVVLAAVTTWALVGLALVLVALIGLTMTQDWPALTVTGAKVRAGLAQLATDLHEAPTRLPSHQVFDQAAAILPYAIVLGGWERWLGALVAADPDDDPDPTMLTWYHGPDDWHLADLPDSLDTLITVMTGRLFTRL
ncbi:MAG: DUF2207 domain-containing protein [Propionibacteriaceae bacterium]|nr:DUF2207 domain-containing protein [Propionibacteriaceae bacterium]